MCPKLRLGLACISMQSYQKLCLAFFDSQGHNSFLMLLAKTDQTAWVWIFDRQSCAFYAPNKKLTEHIGFGLAIMSVHPLVKGFEISYIYSSWKNIWHVFFLVQVISLSGVMPLWIKSEWNLMHAISYEPCMLGFWSFIYGFLMEK